IGPADQHRALQSRSIDHRLHLVGPGPAVAITRRLERLFRIAMAAQIVGDYVEFLGEITVGLTHPRQIALRKAVDEDDAGPVRVAPFLRRNAQPVWRRYCEWLVLQFLAQAGLRHGDEQGGRGTQREKVMCGHHILPFYFLMTESITPPPPP